MTFRFTHAALFTALALSYICKLSVALALGISTGHDFLADPLVLELKGVSQQILPNVQLEVY